MHKAKSKCNVPSAKSREKSFITSVEDASDNSLEHSEHSFISQSQNRSNTVSCYHCKKPHPIYKCEDFLAMSVVNRQTRARALNLCINCLQKGHDLNQCRFGSCKRCNERHNSLLHIDSGNSASIAESSREDTDNNQTITFCNASQCTQVLLATALVEIIDIHGDTHICRALLDSASMSNFVSSALASKLGVVQEPTNISVYGIDRAHAQVSRSCDIQLKSMHSRFSTTLHCLILSDITDNLPSCSFDPSSLDIPVAIKLADPDFHESSKVDILVGADTFWNLLCPGTRHLGDNKPVLQNSKLGWYISGPLGPRSVQATTSCHLTTNFDIQVQLSKFWELEEASSDVLLSEEENEAELHFQRTIRRNDEGRFVVSIPLKEPVCKLGDSREGAVRQFLSLERRIASKPKFRDMYIEFMQEFQDLGHMLPFEPSPNQKVFFSPHHGVFRDDSATTKLRVVFNSSFPSVSGWSYNSLQMVGPTIQDDLLSILLRFRQHTYVISADICKMYRQILVDDEFKPLQLVLWRPNPSQELKTFCIDRIIYGTASAPFLATRCLLQLAIDNKQSHPEASQVIKRDFYVDDLLSGANTVSEAVHLCGQVSSILASAGFKLRKWKSNSNDILNKLEPNDSLDAFYFCPTETCKTLGMLWSSNSDTFSFSINLSSIPKRITKRVILSETAKIFDPLGLLGPVVVRAKIFLQKLWALNVSWDEELPCELSNRWLSFRGELSVLNELHISRHAFCKDLVSIELHGFSDASLHAYGACIYMRTVDSAGDIYVHLLASKTRVAPLKSISVPRLELCAALLLSKLFTKVMSSVSLKFNDICFWCDSTVTLAWIRSSPHNFQVFVGNRITEIQKLTPIDSWKYVPTSKNPADLLSRGTSPSQLNQSKEWFCGPEWLKHSSSYWPTDITLTMTADELPEVRKCVKTFIQLTHNDLFPFNRFSSFPRMQRTMALCLRFIRNCRGSKLLREETLSLTLEELRQATEKLVVLAQRESFPHEIDELVVNGFVNPKTSHIVNLTPFMSNGILRVGGRLKHSSFDFNKKHPALLSPKHHLTYLIVKFEHNTLFHCGPQLLLSRVREKYWPISGKNLCKRIVRECVICFKFKPKFITPMMGDLPEPRVSPRLPFSDVGVDYAGPFQYKDRKGRGAKVRKCYLCLFICLTVKAIHLELVTDLSTLAFLEAFQRFIARRGKPAHVYSDNGSNFVGASKQLDDLGKFLKANNNDLKIQLGDSLDIKWHFIAAYSPHHGGIWEAGIKSAKSHLVKIINRAHNLTFENFYTIVAQVESILNSRPMTPLSTDPNDLAALTPSHFLIGRESQSFPYPDLETTPTNRLTYFEQLEKLKQQFWKRWSCEYVVGLQQRHKWKTQQRDLSVGQLVLLQDNNLPPFKWRLGRISVVHPGADGVVRVVTIKTASGDVKRAVTKVAPLPIE